MLKYFFKRLMCTKCRFHNSLGHFLIYVKKYKIFHFTTCPTDGSSGYVVQCNYCRRRYLYSNSFSLNEYFDIFDKLNRSEKEDMDLVDFFNKFKEFNKKNSESKPNVSHGNSLFVSDLEDSCYEVLAEGYTIVGNMFKEGQIYPCSLLPMNELKPERYHGRLKNIRFKEITEWRKNNEIP